MNRNIDFSRPKLAVFASYIYPHRGAFALPNYVQKLLEAMEELPDNDTTKTLGGEKA